MFYLQLTEKISVHVRLEEQNQKVKGFVVLYEIISRHPIKMSIVSTMVQLYCFAAYQPGYTLVEPPLPPNFSSWEHGRLDCILSSSSRACDPNLS